MIIPFSFIKSLDPDASAFLVATGITNSIQVKAINDLIIDLKGYGIWTKFYAIYPFIGGVATTHKFNLKDPRDLDAAYRLIFSGSFTHSSTGILPDGVTGYADTKLIPSAVMLQNDAHMSFYSRTNNAANGGSDMGATRSVPASRIFIGTRFTGDIYYGEVNQGTLDRVANINSHGYFAASRIASNLKRLARNGAVLSSPTTTSAALPTSSIVIGAINNSGVVAMFSNRECAFASIGSGLTSTELANQYTAVQKYQTTLGRQV